MQRNSLMGALPRSAVCLAVVGEEGRFLSISRRNDTTQWGLPGGKVDAGETNLEALVRECQEELGFVMKPQLLEPVYSGLCPGKGPQDTFWVSTYLWKGEVPQLEALMAEEGMELAWLTGEQLCSGMSPFADYNRAAFNALQRYVGQVQGMVMQPVVVPEADGGQWEPVPQCGDHMSAEDFMSYQQCGAICPGDGLGYWATATHMSGVRAFVDKPDWATHVVWFNR